MNTNHNNQTQQQPDGESHSIRLLTLDTALETTGFAVYEVSTGNFKFKLADFGLLETVTGDDLDSRVRALLRQVKLKISQHQINSLLSEEPSMTVYGGTKLPKNVIIGRATSVFKLMAATYGIVGFGDAIGIHCRTINPVKWQHDILGELKSGESKSASLRCANHVFKLLKINKRLKRGRDENIADAINIGVHAIKQWQLKHWSLPSIEYLKTFKADFRIES